MFDAPQTRSRVTAEIEQQRIRHMRQIATVVAAIMAVFVPILMFSTRRIFSPTGLLVIGASGMATIAICLLARFDAMRGHPQRACAILCAVTTAFVVTASSANPPTIIAPMFLGLPILIAPLAIKPSLVKLMVAFQIGVAGLMFTLVPPPAGFPVHILLIEFGGFYALVAALALAGVTKSASGLAVDAWFHEKRRRRRIALTRRRRQISFDALPTWMSRSDRLLSVRATASARL